MIYNRSPEPCFVAHFDLLGVSAALRAAPAQVWGALCQLLEVRERVLGYEISVSGTGQRISDRVRHFTFSDTIILYTERDEDEDLYAIALLAGELFQGGLDEHLPMRGGLVHGGFIADTHLQLFTGPALVDAYALGESAQWLGLCADETTAQRANALPLRSHGRWPLFTSWEVPQSRSDPVKRCVLDWPIVYHATLGTAPPTSGEEIYRSFSYLFGPWNGIHDHDREKYEHTASFFNARKAAFFEGSPQRGSKSGLQLPTGADEPLLFSPAVVSSTSS